MWDSKTSLGYESRKCRYRVAKYLKGFGLDLGCGSERIAPHALGVDISGEAAQLHLDLGKDNSLRLFADDQFDFVFSSHLLEDMFDTEGCLREWWRVVKPSGYMILYLPHKDLYPNVGQPGANPNHKKDFRPEDILTIMHKFASFDILECNTYSDKDEYSFEIVLRKLPGVGFALSRKELVDKPQKKALVIRYGAAGDMVMITPVLSELKKEGYFVEVECIPDHRDLLDNNPNVDKVTIMQRNTIPSEQLGDYFNYRMKGYDKFINLCESVERTLLYEPCDSVFFADKREREHSVNYYDRTLEIAGYGNVKGKNGELYASQLEDIMGSVFRNKYKDTFNIEWCLKGSAPNKFWLFAEDCMEQFLDHHKDAKIFLVAGPDAMLGGFSHPQVVSMMGKINQRAAMMMTKYVDLVVAPETGVLNASGCFDTPKIGLLTHSNKENLTKYFINDYSIQSRAHCSPCHRLVRNSGVCPKSEMVKDTLAPLCTANFDMIAILKTMDGIYEHWKENKVNRP